MIAAETVVLSCYDCTYKKIAMHHKQKKKLFETKEKSLKKIEVLLNQ